MGQEPTDARMDHLTADQLLPPLGPEPTVVAIDDDPLVLLTIARTLGAAGMVCRTAASGQEGLQLIRDQLPDLVLLDIIMPGEDGFSVCREIRRSWSPVQLPVVMVTALEDLASIQTAYQAGATDYLTKPLHLKHLPYRIRHILRANHAFRALLDTGERYQRITEAITDYIYHVRLAGGQAQTVHGHGCLKVTGYPPEAFGQDPFLWLRMVVDEDRPAVLEQVRRILAGEDPPPIEHRIHHKDGGERWVRNTFVPHLDRQGTMTAYDGLVQDITEPKRAEYERRRLQEERQHSEKLESLGSLAGGMAHDMNNVLAAIMGMASALRAACPDLDPRARPLDSILHASSRGRDLVKALTDFTRKGLEEPRWIDLNELLRKEAELLGHVRLHQIQMQLDLEPDLPMVLGDPSALGGTIMNVGINALDAMPAGGTLTFRSRALPDGRVEMSVTDTGQGMPAEVLARAMEPFYTTKPVGQGTGLGLARVYGTVKAHGGTVELQSEPGRGTSVRILLPAGAAASPSRPAPAEFRAADGRPPLSVLLVDDDDLIQSSTHALLDVLGHDTVAVSSGEEALARLEAGYCPDIVMLDMNMPGLGGAGTLPRLRDLRPSLPVLLATGRADQTALDLVAAYPKVALLSKPFSIRELRQQLDRHGRSGKAAAS